MPNLVPLTCSTHIQRLGVQHSYKAPLPGELIKAVTQSAYLVNSPQKFAFPSTDIYLQLENQSHISIQLRHIED